MIFESLDQAWSSVAHAVLNHGKKVGDTHELSNVHFSINNIEDNLLSIRHNFSLPYYLGEMIWYGAGSNDVDFISKFGKIWNILSDDGKTNNSAYGYILQNKYEFNQIYKMIELLEKDPNSRRAVMNINVPNKNVIETNDEMCTIALQLLVRDGKLNMTGIMRSNDLWTGMPYDIFYFTSLQMYISKALGLEIGTYDHFVTSVHIYDRDIEKIKKSIDNFVKENKTDIKIDGLKLLENATKLYAQIEFGNELGLDDKQYVVKLAQDEGITWREKI